MVKVCLLRVAQAATGAGLRCLSLVVPRFKSWPTHSPLPLSVGE